MTEQLDRRQALVQAAFSAIAEGGFEGFRLRPIAAAAGIDHSTLHHYFRTKADLIAAVLEHVTSQFEATMHNDLDPAARLRQHLSEIATAVAARPELFIVLDELDLRARRDEPTGVAIERDEQGWRDALAAIFTEGVARHVWSVDLDVAASVELVIATVKGIRLRPDQAESVVSQLCDLFAPEGASHD
ncbi:TetR/AcrR family transcriptional regulator [Micromonospora lupini]|uniref:TetR/AcrR family transcriptional regulator n=1 Tax=Micromonospora lupini TaxID=285679 RepID=UPI00225511AA|nr:TetR/AcrR family transcriptional regulator [Micromonospora lupini]MCX5069841.1 TetR/AcrR family transcriptional regulator [Micromonospora lupini]